MSIEAIQCAAAFPSPCVHLKLRLTSLSIPQISSKITDDAQGGTFSETHRSMAYWLSLYLHMRYLIGSSRLTSHRSPMPFDKPYNPYQMRSCIQYVICIGVDFAVSFSKWTPLGSWDWDGRMKSVKT